MADIGVVRGSEEFDGFHVGLNPNQTTLVRAALDIAAHALPKNELRIEMERLLQQIREAEDR